MPDEFSGQEGTGRTQYQMVMLNLLLMRAYVWHTSLQLLPWSANICRLSYETWPLTLFPLQS